MTIDRFYIYEEMSELSKDRKFLDDYFLNEKELRKSKLDEIEGRR